MELSVAVRPFTLRLCAGPAQSARGVPSNPPSGVAPVRAPNSAAPDQPMMSIPQGPPSTVLKEGLTGQRSVVACRCGVAALGEPPGPVCFDLTRLATSIGTAFVERCEAGMVDADAVEERRTLPRDHRSEHVVADDQFTRLDHRDCGGKLGAIRDTETRADLQLGMCQSGIVKWLGPDGSDRPRKAVAQHIDPPPGGHASFTPGACAVPCPLF